MISIVLVLVIIAVALLLLVTEWIPMDATALLVLCALALTGLVTPEQAVSGFSNPAVITVWAVFILSGGLTRTGVANLIGRHVVRWSGSTEVRMIVVVMLTSGILSAFMNNVAVAALMLPVIMDVAHQAKIPPSRVLMPLAFGTLLGGLTTMIGTPPNILVSNILRDADLRPFQLFDFTPVGGLVMVAGIAYMVFIGRHLLPKRDLELEAQGGGDKDLHEQYVLHERIFLMQVPADSVFAGKTLLESRLGADLGLYVVGILRDGVTQLAPGPADILRAGDSLLVEARMERIASLQGWRQIEIVDESVDAAQLVPEELAACEATVAPSSPLDGVSLRDADFRARHGLNVVAISREGKLHACDLRSEPLRQGDRLLLHGSKAAVVALAKSSDFSDLLALDAGLFAQRVAGQNFVRLQVPGHSVVVGRTLREARLGEALGVGVLLIEHPDGTCAAPRADRQLRGGDRLLVKGSLGDVRLLQGLNQLEIEREIGGLESDQVGMAEAILSPRTTLAGKTLREIRFREKYGISVLAIWRGGRPYRTHLGDIHLQLGDAMLLHGSKDRFALLAREPDFIVVSGAAQELPRTEKSKLAMAIMALVLLPVILGLAPIVIMAVTGAALMVVTRCLTMVEAYRAIEWKAIFLIAGLLPLGFALEETGAALLLAETVVKVAGPFGPGAVMGGLLAVTFLAKAVIPSAAIVVLMAPVVLGASASLEVSPYTMMMGLAMAASSSFISPVSHPSNLLVMGPGGYRFLDFVKVGVPLAAVVFLVVMLVVPWLWPFR